MANSPVTQTLSSPKSAEVITYIRPSRGWSALNLRELWQYRELLYFLTWRDVKVRYKQTALGALWAIIQPVLTMVVFTVIFGRVAKIPTNGIPYPIFAYTGLLPWGLFAKALTDAGHSVVSHRTMVTKIYFPRLAIPMASVLGGVVDFFLAFLVLIAMIIYYNFAPGSTYQIVFTPAILTLPLFLILAILTALGVGLWLSALNVLYRDINYIIPFLTQFWLFITPVAYPANIFPEKFQILYALNPMTGVVEGFRWALLGASAAPSSGMVISVSISLIILVTGLFYFRRMEKDFADTV